MRYKINSNKTILLSAFGLKGISQSWFKSKIIIKILSRFTEDPKVITDIFFDELLKTYLEDSQFDTFTYQEVEEFIKEEELFMLGRVL